MIIHEVHDPILRPTTAKATRTMTMKPWDTFHHVIDDNDQWPQSMTLVSIVTIMMTMVAIKFHKPGSQG